MSILLAHQDCLRGGKYTPGVVVCQARALTATPGIPYEE